MANNRKQKAIEYDKKYSEVPRDYRERIAWMMSKYKVSEKQLKEMIERKENMQFYLNFNEYKIVLYEEPEGTPRPRYRMISPRNYPSMAMFEPSYVHVYQPRAKEDRMFGERLIQEQLFALQSFIIQTPFTVDIHTYTKTPSYYSISDKFMAEIGLDWDIKKPDVDNREKKYLDMFNSSLWLDDNMCIKGNLVKFYSELPRVEIFVKYMNYVPNKYQYNHIISRKDFDPTQNLEYLNKNGSPERLTK